MKLPHHSTSFLSALSLSFAASYAFANVGTHAHQAPLNTLTHAAPNETLYITALTNQPDPPHHARIECWSLNNKFNTYPTVGKSLSLGDVDSITYVVLPPRSAEGWHRPPHPMYFVLLSGVAQVYVPATKTNAHATTRQSAGSTQYQANVEAEHDSRTTAQPMPDDENWDFITITPGSPQQILIAADTDLRAKGHLTFYPGNGETVALQIPFSGGNVPGHVVVHEGGCTGDE